LLGGILVVALAEPLSRSDFGGPGWSLKGNGALIVPFALGPAILGVCWGALAVLRWDALVDRWQFAAIVAGAVSLAAGLIFTLLPVLAGPGGATAFYPVLLGVGIPLAALAAGLLQAQHLFGPLGRRALLVSVGVWAIVALVNLLAWGMSALFQPFVLPLLVALPSLTSKPAPGIGWTNGWVVGSFLLVPLCGILGYVLAVELVSRFTGPG
jgi:hypothetical protein